MSAHYYPDKKADRVAELIQLPREELTTMEEASVAQEKAIFSKFSEIEAEWRKQAAETIAIRKAREYLRALPPGMEALTIPRRGAAHDGPAAGGFASASELRTLLRAGRAAEADPYLTAPWSGEAASMAHIDRAVLARLRTMDEVDWAALPDGGAAEGLPARLARSARTADSLEDFYARAKTKRYPHARLRRLALAAFLGLRAAERPPAAPYVRVLGLSGRGRELLRRMKETCALPVVVKPAQARALDGDARALFEAEARRTDLFGLCFPTARPCGLEWTRSPVVKERQG